MSSISSTQLAGIANLALLAPVKPNFVEGCEAFTYAKRLELLLRTLNAIRMAARESAIVESPFPDPVMRADLFQSFRYAIVPPDIGSAGELPVTSETPRPGVYRLSLNVCFDGGWEPYIRVIHRDLGTLLDAIFCNCVGYPKARSHSFDEYTRWVQKYEVAGGLFYSESAASVLDQRYLAGVEQIYRKAPAAAATANVDRAKYRVPGQAPLLPALGQLLGDRAKLVEVVTLHLKALKGLHDLKPLYPRNGEGDDQTLLRFAHSVFSDFRLLLQKARKSPPDEDAFKPFALLAAVSPFKDLLAPFEEAIAWLVSEPDPAPVLEDRGMAFGADSTAQGGIAQRYDGITHGVLALLRVTDAAAARDTLASLAGTALSVEGEARADNIQCNVALTAPGLRALGLPAWRLQRFPREFLEGMEARAGMLGDLRGNHPDRWRRPLLAGVAQKPPSIDLDSVHVLVQYRMAGDSTSNALPAELQQRLDALTVNGKGFQLLAAESMRSWPEANGASGREHFGFRDGLSQPEIAPDLVAPAVARPWDNKVPRGEIFLGHANERGDGPHPADQDTLLDEGSFLAVRKMRQYKHRLEAALLEAAKILLPRRPNEADPAWEARLAAQVVQLKAKMVGRDPDGAPATDPALPPDGNAFTYANDPDGIGCPFHAHVRRANPREGHPTPRIARRGMSYGPREGDDAVERGVFFMAYCASLAEQFEVIQRWITGGNSTRVLSSHGDVLLTVPRAGEPRLFEFFDGPPANPVAHCISLGDQPFTELQWGLYLFAPSVNALKELDAIVSEAPPVAMPSPPPANAAMMAWQRAIEDPQERERTWERVYAERAGLATPYGLLHARKDRVLQALQDDGAAHSVCGYGRRFALTLGPGYLGMDGAAHTQEATGVNKAIAAITVAKAFELTLVKVRELLVPGAAFPARPSADGIEVLLDVGLLSELVLARLCTEWFGLPDDEEEFMTVRPLVADDKPSCPASFLAVSRYVFWPHPAAPEIDKAHKEGPMILQAVQALLDSGTPLVGLSRDIQQALTATGQQGAVARTIAGVMLGFPPTVHVNFLRIMKGWIENRGNVQGGDSLWDLQLTLLTDPVGAAAAPSAQLKAALLRQMRRHPAPEVIWRETPGPAPGPGDPEPEKIVLGLAGVMQKDANADESIMFGGTFEAGPGHGVHACPGYKMAMGVLLGMVTGVLLAGTLRATPSPTVLRLVLHP